MGFKIRHNNYRGGFLVARGGGGCNRWPWTNKSLRITTNPNRSSVITVPMEIRFRGDRRMAKRRARSIHAYSSLFPSLSPSTFSFCFPPVSVASIRIEGRWKRREKGWEGKPGHGYARCFPRPGIRIFSLARETSTLGATVNAVCARIFQIYAAEKLCCEWMAARTRIFGNRKPFFSFSSSFFFHLSGNGIRPISTNILEIYTPVCTRILCARQRAIHLFQSRNPMLNISLQMWFRYQYLTRTLDGNIE